MLAGKDKSDDSGRHLLFYYQYPIEDKGQEGHQQGSGQPDYSEAQTEIKGWTYHQAYPIPISALGDNSG